MVELNKLIDFESMAYNWEEIDKVPEFRVLASCKQNPKWHKEGDAAKHTALVCQKMVNIIREQRINNNPKMVRLLMASALFHDIGKGVTTIFKNNNWHAYNHEFEGERITRKLLWDEGYEFREDVCALVRWHMEPLRIFEGSCKNYLEKMISLSKRVPSLKSLLLLKMADLRGSLQEDMVGKEKDFIKLIEMQRIAKELNMLNEPSKIPTENFIWNKIRRKSSVIVLVGLPGAGKDTYINNQLKAEVFGKEPRLSQFSYDNTVIVCRDDIRAELGMCQEGEKIVGTEIQEKMVTDVFNEKLKKALDEGKNVVINNINLKRKYRDALKNDLADYNCNFIYIYVEASSLDKNLERRKNQVPEQVYSTMIEKFDWPDYTEYDSFLKITN